PLELLFTENETNTVKLFGKRNGVRYFKDGIDDAVVHGRSESVNPELTGTKAGAHYSISVAPGATEVIRLRLRDTLDPGAGAPFGRGFEATMMVRRKEADDFYASLIPPTLSRSETQVMRQALAGMLWSKQYYYFDVDRWLHEHDAHPLRGDQV